MKGSSSREGGPALCGAPRTKAGGAPCRKPAGSGTPHPGVGPCKLHGGCAPGVVQKYERELALADMRFMGVPIDIEPTDSLLMAVKVAAGHLAYLTAKVRLVADEDALESPNGRDRVLNVWGRLQQDAVDRLARVSKMALDAGVAERWVSLAQRAGEQIVGALERAMRDVKLPPAQASALGAAFATQLVALEAADDDTVEGTIAA